jgi:hypothetical protein
MHARGLITTLVRRSATLILAVVIVSAMYVVSASQAATPTTKIVRQIDHILIVTSEANELFALLTDRFQLPIAWPMSDYGGFASGGVSMGNVNLEIIKDFEPATGSGKSRYSGFALEPEPLRISLPELGARGIRHGTPAPFRTIRPDGSYTTRWTTVALPDVSSDVVQVFLCEYEDGLSARRLRLLEQLRSREGGPLSVRSVREIVYGAKDSKRLQEHWQKLLSPLQASSPGAWSVGAGPAIRVIQADKDEIRGLVVSVESLPQARRFLKAHGLFGSEQSDALTVAGSLLQGLNVTLVEQPSND